MSAWNKTPEEQAKVLDKIKSRPLIVVTGASSGIGAAIAQKFSELGHPLLLLSRRTKEMEELKLEKALCVECDVTNMDAFKKAVAEGEAKYGPVDCIVNNAGCMLLGEIATQDPKEWRTMIDVNIVGVANGMQVVADGMRERKAGTIINVSSIAGVKAFPSHAVYCATKFGVHGMTETVRQELAPFGVKVCILAPGVVETPLLSHTTSDAIKEGYKGWKETELKGMPLLPSDIADAAAFMYSQHPRSCIRELVIGPTYQLN